MVKGAAQMYQGNNPSAIRSRNEIVKAFLELLAAHDLDAISIKQIMDATDLSRQTFYQIFSSKEDILEYYLDVLFGSFIEHSRGKTIESLCDAAKLFFSFFADYRDCLSETERAVLYSENAENIYSRSIMSIMRFQAFELRRSSLMRPPLRSAAWWLCWSNGYESRTAP